MANTGTAAALIVTIESRALKRTLGPLAWAVLEDVTLDAAPQDGRWLAVTSTRQVAEHLGLTPGTVARALARLCTEGLVHREDRRDTRTGRFGESVYVVAPIAALLLCVDPPDTVRRSTERPNTARPAPVVPHEAPPSTADEGRQPNPARRSGFSGRRRPADSEQQLSLGDELATAPLPLSPSTTTTTKAQQPNHATPQIYNPRARGPKTSEPLNPTSQRSSDTCQPSGQALPGRASC